MVQRYVSQDPFAMVHKRELAKLLGLSPWTLDQWRKRGLIPQPIVLTEQTLVWRRRDIELWLREREAQSIELYRKPIAER